MPRWMRCSALAQSPDSPHDGSKLCSSCVSWYSGACLVSTTPPGAAWADEAAVDNASSVITVASSVTSARATAAGSGTADDGGMANSLLGWTQGGATPADAPQGGPSDIRPGAMTRFVADPNRALLDGLRVVEISNLSSCYAKSS